MVCSNTIAGSAAALPSNALTRVTVGEDLVQGTFLVYVGGDLVAKGLASPTAVDVCHGFAVWNQDENGSALLDDVWITATTPADLIAGSVYTIR